MDDDQYRRYVHVNLPHARTVLARIGRSLTRLGAPGAERNGGTRALDDAYAALEQALQAFEDDPPAGQALAAADQLAQQARTLVAAILETNCRGDRLGQSVRNLFECLGLPEEGAELALRCGERPDSLLR